MKIIKRHLKGSVAGFLMCALLSTTMLAAANTETVTRQITYGVNVVLNGERVQFNEDSRPFVMDGRTFLPLRALAELLDMPVDFDPVTNTAIVGTATQIRGTSVGSLFFDGTVIPNAWNARNVLVEARDSVIMGGNIYNDTVIFTATQTGGLSSMTFTQSAMLNLNARYNWLNLSIGRVDGSAATVNTNVSIFVDDRLVESFEQSAQSLPRELRLFVEGARAVRVEMITNTVMNQTASYAIAGFAE